MTKDPNKIQIINREQLRIVCAANKHKQDENLLLIGARHWDNRMHAQWKVLQQITSYCKLDAFDFIQGFIDNMGDFHTREEAFKIATKANQIIEKTGGKNSIQLFSEDLY